MSQKGFPAKSVLQQRQSTVSWACWSASLAYLESSSERPLPYEEKKELVHEEQHSGSCAHVHIHARALAHMHIVLQVHLYMHTHPPAYTQANSEVFVSNRRHESSQSLADMIYDCKSLHFWSTYFRPIVVEVAPVTKRTHRSV